MTRETTGSSQLRPRIVSIQLLGSVAFASDFSSRRCQAYGRPDALSGLVAGPPKGLTGALRASQGAVGESLLDREILIGIEDDHGAK